MYTLEIRQVKDQREFNHIREIRTQIFVHEQQVPNDIEFDGLDQEAEHVIVYFHSKPIGCARIRTNDCVKLERIAILKEYRMRGFGKQLMEYLINYCKNKRYQEICIHSQTYVSEFYRKCGFKARGETFLEAGIEHIEMYLETGF